MPLKTRRSGIDHRRQLPRARLAADASGATWNVLMPAGEWHRPDFPGGVIKCDRAFFEAMISNYRKVGSPGLPVDRFHWGSSSFTEVTDPKAKAAVGFIEDLRVSADGDLEGLTRWNADGKADLEADRYRYFSPEWHEDWTDAASGDRQGPTLFGGSLLNDPFFKSMPALAASDVVPTKENPMTREELLELYGLPKTATDADIKAAARKGAEAATATKTAADEESKRIAAAAKRTGELEAELKQAKDKLATADAEKIEAGGKALCEKLETEGRIVAAEKADVLEDVRSMGLEKATARWAKRSVVVVLKDGKAVSKDGDKDDPKAAADQFDALVTAEMEKSKLPYSQASRRVGSVNPELYRKAMQPAAYGTKPGEMARH